MTRLFLRIMYMTFLWIILIANLFMAFDLIQLVSPLQGGVYNGDLSNRYFGVSTLIEALKNIDSLPIGSFARGLGQHQKDVFLTIERLKGNVGQLFNATEPNDILGFLKRIVEVLFAIGNIVALIGSYIYAFGVTIVFYTTMFFELMYTIIAMFNGYYSTELPSTIHPVMNNAISNCITPLLTAV